MTLRPRHPRRGGLVAAPLLLALLAAPAAARDCAVTAREGAPARIWSDGEWRDLELGPLPAGSQVIATGPAARLEITCDDGVTVTVGFGAEVTLETLVGPSDRAGSVVLQLLRGIVGVVAPRRTWESFEVRAPLAIASARSTEWLAEHAEATGSTVFVREGRVAVRPARGAAVTLEAGEGVTQPPEGPAAPVLRWGPPRVAGAAAALGFGWR